MSTEIAALPSVVHLKTLLLLHGEVVDQVFERLQTTEQENKRLRAEIDRQRVEVNHEKAAKELSRREVKALKQAEQNHYRNSYAIVLIDAHNSIFLDELLKDPKRGARDAAERLQEAVHRSLASFKVPGHEGCRFRLLVTVYADVEELAESLHKSGIIKSKDDLATFAKTFTGSNPYFDFVNTGSNRDNKLDKMLSHHYIEDQCKKIFLAGCHGNSCFTKLYCMNNSNPTKSLDKFVVIETTPASQRLLRRGFEVVHFDDVFRRKPLPVQEGQAASSNNEPISTLCREMPGRISPYINQGPVDQELPCSSTSVPCAPPMQRSVPQSNIQYKPIILDEIPTGRTIYFNEHHQRIDLFNKPPQADLDAYDRIVKDLRKSGGKGFCNAHYINGDCKGGDKCIMEHNVKLTESEMNGLRHRARRTKCKFGAGCRDFDCFASHHCPLDKKCDPEKPCRFLLHLGLGGNVVRYCLKEGERELKPMNEVEPIHSLYDEV